MASDAWPFFFISAHVNIWYKVHQSTHRNTLGECHKSVSSWLRGTASFLTIISCIMSQIWKLHSPTVLPWILIPHSDWFIFATPQKIMPLINWNDASIPTSFFPFFHNFQGRMRDACGNRNSIKAEKLPRKTADYGYFRCSIWVHHWVQHHHLCRPINLQNRYFNQKW